MASGTLTRLNFSSPCSPVTAAPSPAKACVCRVCPLSRPKVMSLPCRTPRGWGPVCCLTAGLMGSLCLPLPASSLCCQGEGRGAPWPSITSSSLQVSGGGGPFIQGTLANESACGLGTGKGGPAGVLGDLGAFPSGAHAAIGDQHLHM